MLPYEIFNVCSGAGTRQARDLRTEAAKAGKESFVLLAASRYNTNSNAVVVEPRGEKNWIDRWFELGFDG